MWDVKACLACLSTESKLERITDIFQRFYMALTGIKLSDIDGYPMYFCMECHSQIRKALLFKRKCRRAYYVLKEIATVKKQVTLRDINTVNRRRVNLESVITYSKLENVDLFSIDRVEPDVETLIANLDKQEIEEPKCDLIKEYLLVTGNVWHIDIKPTGIEEPVIEPEYKDDEPTIEDVELNNETVSPEEDHSEAVLNDDNVIDQDSDDELPEPKPKAKVKLKKKVKIGNVFKVPMKTLTQVTEASFALSNANIRRLSIDEQKILFTSAQTQLQFLKAPFKCGMCLTVYQNMNDLMKHVTDHNKFINSKHMCEICKTKFVDEQVLSVHTATNHLYEYTCMLCKKVTFNNMEQYILHSKEKHKEPLEPKTKVHYFKGNIKECFDMYPVDRTTMYAKLAHMDCRYECNTCNMKFLSMDYLETHVKKHTPFQLEKSYKCDICGIFTSGSFIMTQHMDACHLYVYKCKMCSELLFNRQEAKFHKSQKHQPPDPNYSCDVCDKTYKNRNALRQHRSINHYSQMFCHHCIECGDSFCSLFNLFKHQLTMHMYIIIDDPNTTEERFPCDSCDVKFLSFKSYQRHALKHRHEEANTFENACMACRVLYDTADEYQDHITTSCKNRFRYPQKCAYCDLIMLDYKMYVSHHKRTHKGNPMWRLRDTQLCDLCGQAAFDIVDHMKKHGEKEVNLECRHCSPPVRLRDVWKYCVHMFTFHTPKPFICAFCLEAYPTRKECKDHILKVHAPENPYKCMTCNQEFSHVDYLNEHSKKFLHLNTKRPKRVYTTKKLYVYPHMKLNVSMFDRSVLKCIRLFLCDYGKTKGEYISDIKDYIVFDKQEVVTCAVIDKKKEIKKVVGDGEIELSPYGKKMEIVEELVVNQSDDFNMVCDRKYDMTAARVKEVKLQKEKSEKKVEVARQVDLDMHGQELDTGLVSYGNIVFGPKDLLPPVKKKKRKLEEMENRVDTGNLELGLDNGEKLNVIEQDGNQYVSLNGTLYQVVYEDESTEHS